MKNISTYISEKLKISSKPTFNEHPNSPDELNDVLVKYVHKYKDNIDLNDIDVSDIDNFSFAFNNIDEYYDIEFDVSEWDVSEGKSFLGMFAKCKSFNSDISNWNMSKAINL